MNTITAEQQQRIADTLARMTLPSGLGTEKHACSVAAINLALSGKLTDTIPECMSEVIGRWIIAIQDAMPPDVRNSAEWKSLLPLAAGTGREREPERLAIILDWMWTEALPLVQPTADAGGYGDAWRDMCCGRNEELARKAAEAAARVASCFDEPLRLVATWAGNSARAGSAARAAAWAAEGVAQAAARAAVRAARAEEAWAEREEAWENCWETLNPCGLLKRLIET